MGVQIPGLKMQGPVLKLVTLAYPAADRDWGDGQSCSAVGLMSCHLVPNTKHQANGGRAQVRKIHVQIAEYCPPSSCCPGTPGQGGKQRYRASWFCCLDGAARTTLVALMARCTQFRLVPMHPMLNSRGPWLPLLMEIPVPLSEPHSPEPLSARATRWPLSRLSPVLYRTVCLLPSGKSALVPCGGSVQLSRTHHPPPSAGWTDPPSPLPLPYHQKHPASPAKQRNPPRLSLHTTSTPCRRPDNLFRRHSGSDSGSLTTVPLYWTRSIVAPRYRNEVAARLLSVP